MEDEGGVLPGAEDLADGDEVHREGADEEDLVVDEGAVGLAVAVVVDEEGLAVDEGADEADSEAHNRSWSQGPHFCSHRLHSLTPFLLFWYCLRKLL